jgi:hypothetical protein
MGLGPRFAQVEEISEVMKGYVRHGATARALVPSQTSRNAPSPQDYLPSCVRFWLDNNSDRVLSRQAPLWLTGMEGSS